MITTILNGRLATNAHMLKASIGISGGSKTVTCGRNVTPYMTTFVSARAPKNATMNLFLRVIAYNLRRIVSASHGTNEHDIPQDDEDVRGC